MALPRLDGSKGGHLYMCLRGRGVFAHLPGHLLASPVLSMLCFLSRTSRQVCFMLQIALGNSEVETATRPGKTGRPHTLEILEAKFLCDASLAFVPALAGFFPTLLLRRFVCVCVCLNFS